MKQEKKVYATKLMLASSLKKIMEKKSFSKITVNEIVDDCELNRNTFYYHFEDTYALLEWMLKEDAIDIIKQFRLITDYQEALSFVFDYLEKNNHIINCALDSIGRDALKKLFHNDFFAIIHALILDVEQEEGVSLQDSYRDFITDFYTNALTGMLMEHLQQEDFSDRRLLLDYYVSTVRASLLGIMAEHRA